MVKGTAATENVLLASRVRHSGNSWLAITAVVQGQKEPELF